MKIKKDISLFILVYFHFYAVPPMCSFHVIEVHFKCVSKLFLAGHVLGDLSKGTFKLFIMITRDSG